MGRASQFPPCTDEATYLLSSEVVHGGHVFPVVDRHLHVKEYTLQRTNNLNPSHLTSSLTVQSSYHAQRSRCSWDS